MAGPGVIILTPRKMSGENRQQVEKLVTALSGGLSGADRFQDFRIVGRPFILWFGSETTDDEVEPDLPSDIPIGFAPKGQVGLAAMCNQSVDHILLATLASRLSTVLEGVVWLDGQLRLDQITAGVAGLTTVGPHTHIATAQFINRWIESPSFRLPK